MKKKNQQMFRQQFTQIEYKNVAASHQLVLSHREAVRIKHTYTPTHTHTLTHSFVSNISTRISIFHNSKTFQSKEKKKGRTKPEQKFLKKKKEKEKGK